MVAPGPRHSYVTAARHQLDERPLLLRGGPLDGRAVARVAAVGQRVFCGEGEWSTDGLYVVTGETSSADGDGHVRNIAVPAFA